MKPKSIGATNAGRSPIMAFYATRDILAVCNRAVDRILP